MVMKKTAENGIGINEEAENLGGGDGEGYSWEDCARRLCRCGNCGALFFNCKIKFLAMASEQDEIRYNYYILVSNRKEAQGHSENFTGPAGLCNGKKIWFNGRKWYWDKQ
jgi:hypothetical protein